MVNSLLPGGVVGGAEDDSSVVSNNIKESLQCNAATTERVEFSNATDLFLYTVRDDNDDDGHNSSGGRTVFYSSDGSLVSTNRERPCGKNGGDYASPQSITAEHCFYLQYVHT